jgi:hypothetical protein
MTEHETLEHGFSTAGLEKMSTVVVAVMQQQG